MTMTSVVIILVLICFFICAIFALAWEKYYNKIKFEVLNKILLEKDEEIKSRDRTIAYLRNMMNSDLYRYTNLHTTSNSYSEDVIEAVKFAMIHAHPDNGGDPNTFIKYKNLYDKIK